MSESPSEPTIPSEGPPDGSILRLLDANANRAREALRVLEDYARFVLDSADLGSGWKEIRHGLRAALEPILPEAILHRDTPGDVGVAVKTDAELTRADLADVVTAAGKRLGEALRAIEEYLKTVDPAAAAKVESLRYATYELERRVATTLRPAACDFSDVRLYVLITESICKRPWLEAAEAALRGGADCLQLREKSLDSGEFLRRARELVALCRQYKVPCIINDRPDIAILAGADGVHVGQEDLPAAEARKIVGSRRIVGVSTHRLEQAKQAVLDGADYIGVGPFFRSSTKPRDFVAGPGYARQVAEQIKLPAVAIAGITADNVHEVVATGIEAVAVSAAVIGQEDVEATARELKARLRAPTGGRTFLSVTRDQKAASSVSPPSSKPPIVEQVSRRHLPHWHIQGATCFITFRARSTEFDPGERTVILEHLKYGHNRFYGLIGAVVMPDHVHAVLTPIGDYTLSRIMQGTKGVTANLINRRRQTRGSLWQEESWDRIIRTNDALYEQLQYMLDNPVRKGLVTDGWDYPWWCYNSDRRG